MLGRSLLCAALTCRSARRRGFRAARSPRNLAEEDEHVQVRVPSEHDDIRAEV
jgi:hypothetical protein